ncbi:MAG: hypothetical protein HOC79_00590 [Euryarchaeota archaeon]|jgi:Gpi18-like mannosyltransferase|nr:hypothetical protein [Euryarchaeota archaeon]
MWLSNPRLSQVIELINQKFVRMFDKFETFSNKKVYFSFFLLTFIMASPMLLAYELADDSSRFEHKDLDIFRDRAQTIIDGDLLYRDTDHVTLSPPLINYLFVPAVLLGNTAFIWTLWFCVFIFTSAVILHRILTSFFDKRYAIAGTVFYIVSPLSHYTTVMMMQDDAIIVNFLLLSFLFMIRKSWYKAAAVFGFGAMTKLFPALCAPLAAIGPELWKNRFITMFIGLGIGIIVTLPFLIYATDEFLQFLNFYLTGQQPSSDIQMSETVSDIDQRGMSFWRYLGENIIFVPSSILHIIFVLAIITTWVAALMKKVEIIPAATLCILWIFIFYSKVHYGYHLMIFSLLIPWALPHPKQVASLGVMSFFLILIHRMWRQNSMIQNTMVQLSFATVMWVYWIYWARVLLKERENDFSCRKECPELTVIVVSWFTVFCIIYYLLAMVQIML